ncbi:hypothetical protein A2U01_0073086, partial [Trifolium medium]|nr:hypothetical protein [Trifolium medium]
MESKKSQQENAQATKRAKPMLHVWCPYECFI